MEKRRNCSLGETSPLFHNIFCLLLDVRVSAGTRFSLRDKRLFEISEFEITRVNCIDKLLGVFLYNGQIQQKTESKLMLFFLFFPENRLKHFMQIVSLGDNLHEMSEPIFR